MKTFNKVLLSIVGISFIVGIVLVICGFAMGARDGFGWNGMNGSSVPTTMVSEQNIDPFTRVDIYTSFGDVEFIESDTFGLEVTSSRKSEDVYYTNKDGKLTVKIKADQKQIMFFDFSAILNFFNNDNFDESIKVYIPKATTFEDVNITCSAGTIDVADFNTDKFTINNDFGSLDMQNINAKTFDIKMSSGKLTAANITTDTFKYDNDFGDTNLNNITAENVVFVVSSGKIKMGNCNFKSLNGESDFGNIECSEVIVEDDLKLECASGKIKFDGDFKSADINSDFGSIDIRTNHSREDYKLELGVDFGSIRLDGDKQDSRVSSGNSSKPTLKVFASSGDIDITFR